MSCVETPRVLNREDCGAAKQGVPTRVSFGILRIGASFQSTVGATRIGMDSEAVLP